MSSGTSRTSIVFFYPILYPKPLLSLSYQCIACVATYNHRNAKPQVVVAVRACVRACVRARAHVCQDNAARSPFSVLRSPDVHNSNNSATLYIHTYIHTHAHAHAHTPTLTRHMQIHTPHRFKGNLQVSQRASVELRHQPRHFDESRDTARPVTSQSPPSYPSYTPSIIHFGFRQHEMTLTRVPRLSCNGRGLRHPSSARRVGSNHLLVMLTCVHCPDDSYPNRP